MLFVPHRKNPYRSPRPITETALHFYMWMLFVLHREHICESPLPITEIASFLYDVRTSQETGLWPSTTCYEDSFTFSYIEAVRTAHGTYLGASTTCYEIALLFIYRWCSYRIGNTHMGFHSLLRGIAFHFYKYMVFVPYRKHMPPQPVTRDSFPFL
jgi:hypothetical protein